MKKTQVRDIDTVISTGRQIDYFKKNALARRLQLLKEYGIDLILDVGANTGQYAQFMRKLGYKGKIVSFEPMAKEFSRLQAKSLKDPKWKAVPLALGKQNQESEIHVSQYSQCSSLLEMLPAHLQVADYFSYKKKEKIQLRKLDSIFDDYVRACDSVFLKIDTQGFEKPVLEGAKVSLKKVVGIQIEMSLIPLYKGEALMPEMIDYLSSRGFALMSLEYGFCHPKTGRLLQVDGIFFRESEKR